MNTDNYFVSFDPTPDHMDEIYSWTTFPPNNFPSIDQSYRKKNICIVTKENKVVGFFAYKLTSRCVEIVIAETKKEFRSTGIAKLLLNTLSKHLNPKGYLAYHLYCAPEESQYAWKKLGFEYYPESQYGKADKKIEMFKIFGDCCTVVENSKNINPTDNVIKIWDYNIGEDDDLPRWIVKFDMVENSKKLVKPFLFFGEDDWKIKVITQDGSQFCRYKDYDRKSEVTRCFYIDELK
ncbi:GNAT family N-acetyltransferase [Chryseobacterium sp. PBS4-4]|uniref:GNAT family N-acetyltransferase n=1 Tax=Chryseobacterium edaphi TaxID=2976532 RepID=A0ABT2W8F8_9FLAO|nr:GNAT family N-acetyltransferase [Chryseobacterium edaphi]MCU7618481.1 GNAT family N-acetyltransferase [Chryseobacterium edaphi]